MRPAAPAANRRTAQHRAVPSSEDGIASPALLAAVLELHDSMNQIDLRSQNHAAPAEVALAAAAVGRLR